MNVRRLTWGECAVYEDQLRPFIEQVLDEDPIPIYSAEAILNDLFEANSQAWIMEADGAIVGIVGTQIQRLPLAKVLLIDMAASLETHPIDWPEILTQLRAFGKENECTVVKITGRKGWERVLRDEGMTSRHTVLWGYV